MSPRTTLTWSVLAALGLLPTGLWAAPLTPDTAVLPTAAEKVSGKEENERNKEADAASDTLEFSPAFLGSGKGTVDLSRFATGPVVLPGNYNVDIYVNEGYVGRQTVPFRTIDGARNAQPCFTYSGLLNMGVDMNKADPVRVNTQNDCIAIRDISPDATTRMDVGKLRLDVSVPQASMLRQARGYVSPELWDDGEPAFLLGYNLNAYTVNQRHNGARDNLAGWALGIDGKPVPVQNGTYYRPGPGGSYAPGQDGDYMLDVHGTYVPVQPGSFRETTRSAASNTDTSVYLGLNLGLNLGGWRLRNTNTLQWNQGSGQTQWHSFNTTATHDVTRWQAQFSIGDSYTQGIVFDSTPFRGATIYSDDRMLANSQQGFAPVVRGMANTQARVEVRQNGNLLLETTVAPGPFTIDDLYATGYGGDLTVTVFEADGNTHSFRVPYSAVPMLLRPGIGRWALTTGQVRDTSLMHDKPEFVEGTYQRGINNWLTLYAGVQSTYDSLYRSLLGGVAVNTPLGAFALDTSNSHSRIGGTTQRTLTGSNYRLSYAKTLPTWGTTFALATYRYSNSHFLSLADAARMQDMYQSTPDAELPLPMRTRQRMQLTLNQNFGDRYGSLYFTGSRDSYWGSAAESTTCQMGYSNRIAGINFSLNAGRTYTTNVSGGRYANQIGLNISVPLGGPSSRTPINLSLAAQHDEDTGNNARVGLNGSFGERNQYSYNLNANHADPHSGDAQTGVSTNLGWQAPYASLNGGYSWDRNYQQGSFGMMGGMVAHRGGISLAPQLDLNNPVAVIEAPDARGARVSSSGSAIIDRFGYALATGLTPYRLNDVTLDPTGASLDVALQTTRVQTAPRAGAVVALKFDTVSGRATLIRTTRPNGEPLPFGAEVFDDKGQSIGSVGQNGQVFVHGQETGGELTARWGEAASQQCQLSYRLPPRPEEKRSQALSMADAVCQ